MVHVAPNLCTVSQRLRRGRYRDWQPTPLRGPQVRGMNAVCASQFLQRTVLGKQSYRRGSFALQYAIQIFSECKARALHAIRGLITAEFRTLHKFLCQRLHRTQNFCRGHQAHHLQRPHRLVKLLASDTQVTGIKLRQIRASCQFGITYKPAHRFGRTVQRLAQLVQHPSQRAQIADR